MSFTFPFFTFPMVTSSVNVVYVPCFLGSIMYLMYYLDGAGKRVYTLKRLGPDGKPTLSAHPARFSPEDKYSKERITLKRRFGVLLTQQSLPTY